MTDEKTCYNCGNKNCNVYYSTVKKDYKRHFETYEYNDFDCVNHDKWEELKVEEIRTDNTETLKNALERIKELEKENEVLKERADKADLDSVLFFNQLCKAKAIIKDYMIIATNITVCSVPEENRCINVLKLNEQAEQFLKVADNDNRKRKVKRNEKV